MESTSESQALVPAESRPLKTVAGRTGMLVPRVIAEAGDQAARRFLEFFAATIRNKNTRMAYYHAVARFFAWVDRHKIGEIADIEPLHVAAYIEILGKDFEKPTVKQHLAAIRMLFDWLVTGQVVATNPAHAVRGLKHVVKTGKTTVLTGEQARELLDSIDTSTLVGLRDRALISVMTFAFARIGAVVLPAGSVSVAATTSWSERMTIERITLSMQRAAAAVPRSSAECPKRFLGMATSAIWNAT